MPGVTTNKNSLPGAPSSPWGLDPGGADVAATSPGSGTRHTPPVLAAATALRSTRRLRTVDGYGTAGVPGHAEAAGSGGGSDSRPKMPQRTDYTANCRIITAMMRHGPVISCFSRHRHTLVGGKFPPQVLAEYQDKRILLHQLRTVDFPTCVFSF